MLKASDAVAAIITLEDDRYLMHLRDDKPEIWYPNHWGCFGGAVDAGETPEQALRRELYEELELAVGQTTYFTRFDYDFEPFGMKKCFRIYYLLRISQRALSSLTLHEGRAVKAISYGDLTAACRVTPYDLFAIELHHQAVNRVS